MAFQNYLTEEELQKQQGAAASGGGSAIPSNASSAISGSNAAGGASPGPAKGTGWVNLQNYLNANAGQGAQTTQRVLEGADSQIKSAVDGINKQSADTQKAIQSGSVQRNDQLLSQLKTDPSKVSTQDYRNYTGQTYKGPQGIQDNVGYADTVNQYNKASDIYKNVQTKEGREASLAESLNDPRYSRGMSFLDSYLMQQEGQPQVDSFVEKNKGLTGALTDAQKSASDAATAAAASSQRNVQDVSAAARAERDALAKDAQERLLFKNDTIANEIFDYNRTHQAELNKRNNAYGVNPRDFVVGGGESQYSMGDVLTNEDRARMKALSDMMGESDSFYGANASGRAGAYFDEQAFNDALAAATPKLIAKNAALSPKSPVAAPIAAPVLRTLPTVKKPTDVRAPVLLKDINGKNSYR